MKILQVKSSILGSNSTSSKYVNKLTELIRKENDIIIERNVAEKLVTPLSFNELSNLSNTESNIYKEHLSLINEINHVDKLILAAPMYNFNIPSTLKNYFDAISKAGITFKYTETGPVGLLKDIETYIIITRGGKYKENNLTFQEDYIRLQLNFLGLKNLKFIFIEGIAMGLNEETLNASFNDQMKDLINE